MKKKSTAEKKIKNKQKKETKKEMKKIKRKNVNCKDFIIDLILFIIAFEKSFT